MKPKIILLGAGGHCTSCIDVIEQEFRFEIAGIIDINNEKKSLLNYPLLGNDGDLDALRSHYEFAFITIGQIKTSANRIKLYKKLNSLKFTLPTIISPQAYVSKHATIGVGTIIMGGAFVNAKASIGDNCIINTKAIIEHDVKVESHSHISTGSIVNGFSIIKAGTFIGSNSTVKEHTKTNLNDFIKAGTVFKGYQDE